MPYTGVASTGEKYTSHSPRGWKPKIKGPADPFSWCGLSCWCSDAQLFCSVLTGQGGGGGRLSGVSFCKATNPILKDFSLLTHLAFIARRSNQSILKGTNAEYSLGGLMLKPQYFGQLMQRADSLEKTLMLGQIEGRRRRGRQMRWLDGITDSMDMNLSKLQKIVKERESWHAVCGIAKSPTRLSD